MLHVLRCRPMPTGRRLPTLLHLLHGLRLVQGEAELADRKP